jgi:competence protein ComEC
LKAYKFFLGDFIMKNNLQKIFCILALCFFTTQIFAELKVHFIDVGQADSILIQCDGENLLLDGGNKADSSLIYSYLKKYEITNLKYVINSHPHEDHVGGLSGALNFAKANQVFSSFSEYDSKAFYDFVKNTEKQNLQVEILKAGSELSLGNAKIKVLGPIFYDDKMNNNSLVLHLVYDEISFLFTGDMEFDEERSLLDLDLIPQCTVLKVAHHGSENATSYRLLRSVLPQVAVISVGKNNPYNHPSESVLSKLEDAQTKVFRTDLNGDIIISSDGKKLEILCER